MDPDPGLQGGGAAASSLTKAARRVSRSKPASVSAPVQFTGKARAGSTSNRPPEDAFATPAPAATEQTFSLPTLQTMLVSPVLRQSLLAYARQVYQEESLLFWVACNEWATLVEPAERIRRARKIWADFLEPGAPFEVCVDFARRTETKRLLDEGVDAPPDLFVSMTQELENIMQHNMYTQFCREARNTGRLDFALRAQGKEMPEHEQREERTKAALLLENLLIEPDNYGVLYALCQVYTIHDVSHETEERDFLSGVNEILLQNNCLFTFIDYVVKREVDVCSEANTLFRQRTVFTLLLADILKRQPCVRFLHECTSALFAAVAKIKAPFAIDTAMLDDQSQETANACATKVVKLADGVLQTVRRNFPKCPPSLRKICELLSAATGAKFPHLRWSILGSVLFLRFLCPAICSPESFSFVKDVSVPQRKALVLVSKVLQMATNRVDFEDDQAPSLRGAHHIINEWLHALQAHDDGMKELFGNFVTMSDDDWTQSDISAPSTSGNASLATSPVPPAANAVQPSPRKRFGDMLNTLQTKMSHATRRSHGEVMGLRLTQEESLALRYRVLDTLTQHQASVEALVSNDTKCMTQWMWLKESLRLQNSLNTMH